MWSSAQPGRYGNSDCRQSISNHHNQQQQQQQQEQEQQQQRHFSFNHFVPESCERNCNGFANNSFFDDAKVANSAVASAATTAPTQTVPVLPQVEDPDLSQLPKLRQSVRRHAHAVIQCLPSHQVQAYQEALRHLSSHHHGHHHHASCNVNAEIDHTFVHPETDPLPFIRYCDYDVYAGVQRLCLYWTERVKLFGRERAFLPLTLTGTGALTPHDLLSMRAGFPALLPDNTKTGQKCFLFDRRCKIPNASPDHMLRCLFYLFHVLAENDLSQVQGALGFVVAATPRSKEGDMDWTLVRRGAALVSKVFPVKVELHLLCIPQLKKPNYAFEVVEGTILILQHYFNYQQKQQQRATSASSGIKIQVHKQTPHCPKDKILHDLIEVGLGRPGIPLFFGGNWALNDFFQWCQSRMEQEFLMYKNQLIQQSMIGGDWTKITQAVCDENIRVTATVAPTFRATKAQRLDGGGGQRTDLRNDFSLGKDPLAQQRLEDVMRSRRRRERQKLELESLKRNSSELQEQNLQLKEEQQRLHRLVTEAEQCIVQLSSPTTTGSGYQCFRQLG